MPALLVDERQSRVITVSARLSIFMYYCVAPGNSPQILAPSWHGGIDKHIWRSTDFWLLADHTLKAAII